LASIYARESLTKSCGNDMKMNRGRTHHSLEDEAQPPGTCHSKRNR
jgi:hypothetical protein